MRALTAAAGLAAAVLFGFSLAVPHGEEETVTLITVSGPCSCTARIYVAGAEVDSAAWRVSGDTLHILIEVK